MRYFFSTGEASGELTAVALAQAIAHLDPAARFEGIGSERMRAAGFTLRYDNTGWASLGIWQAIRRIPKLLVLGWKLAFGVVRSKPDLVVLVDFGGFNVRFAKVLRFLRFGGPILDVYPPGTWLDNPKRARELVRYVRPLTAFAHQRDFFESLGLPIAFFGHPLASRYTMRTPRAAPPEDSGTVAILPGSRASELRHHVPVLLEAVKLLKIQRPNLRVVAGPADERARRFIEEAAARAGLSGEIACSIGVAAAVSQADAAWVSSGTAVLECALSGVPLIVLYIVSPRLEAYAQRVRAGRFIALPNLVLKRRVVPEFLQEQATPENLAREMDALLRDPAPQYAAFAELREALGPPDALERCAAFVVDLAKGAR